MDAYHAYLRDILDNGTRHRDRTGTGTTRVFGRQLRFDLTEGFPLITTKRVWMKGVTVELLWFLSGGTNIRPLLEEGVSIWTDWPLKRYREATGEDVSQEAFEKRVVEDDAFAAEWGELGPVYGKQWRDFAGEDGRVDQIARLVENLRETPGSRRHLVSAWQPAEIGRMALPPCHYAFQCFVDGEPGDGRLSLMWQQRSVDSFLGLPFNVASYALLTHMLAQQTGLEVGELIFHGGDCHVYDNHRDVVTEQLTRDPYPLPTLELAERDSIFDYELGDVEVKGYQHHPVLRAPIAV
jgi:thymidylate synthase